MCFSCLKGLLSPLQATLLFKCKQHCLFHFSCWCLGKAPRNANGTYVHSEDKNAAWDGWAECCSIVNTIQYFLRLHLYCVLWYGIPPPLYFCNEQFLWFCVSILYITRKLRIPRQLKKSPNLLYAKTVLLLFLNCGLSFHFIPSLNVPLHTLATNQLDTISTTTT